MPLTIEVGTEKGGRTEKRVGSRYEVGNVGKTPTPLFPGEFCYADPRLDPG